MHTNSFRREMRAGLTGVLPSDRVAMLMDVLILSEDREGGEGLLFSRISCVCRKSCQSCWILTTCARVRYLHDNKIHIITDNNENYNAITKVNL